ncbi:MAG TPA: MerR family transcriptional regulator [Acidimicrobiales bacterium]
MRIGELADRTGVSVRAVRYYEDQGLLEPTRQPNGYRSYDEAAVERVRQIQHLYAAGLCSSKIAELLPCIRTEGERVVADPGLIDELAWECGRIEGQIEEMQASLRLLRGILASARAAAAREAV